MTKRWRKVYAILFLILTAVSGICFCFAQNYRKQLDLSGRTQVVDTLNNRINRTCMQVLNGYHSTDFLYENQYSDKSVNLTINQACVARLATDIVDSCLNDLACYEKLLVGIPIGSVTGSTYLADKGMIAHYTLRIGYEVTTDYQITYQSVGINQIRYALYLVVKTTAHIIVPRNMKAVENVSYIPVCDKIYSGEVPNVFVNGQDETNYLDLIP